MRIELPVGPPMYKEWMGKTCAFVEVSDQVRVVPGDQWTDQRGHIWTVDYASEGSLPNCVRLALFSSVSSATLRSHEEIHRLGSTTNRRAG